MGRLVGMLFGEICKNDGRRWSEFPTKLVVYYDSQIIV